MIVALALFVSSIVAVCAIYYGTFAFIVSKMERQDREMFGENR